MDLYNIKKFIFVLPSLCCSIVVVVLPWVTSLPFSSSYSLVSWGLSALLRLIGTGPALLGLLGVVGLALLVVLGVGPALLGVFGDDSVLLRLLGVVGPTLLVVRGVSHALLELLVLLCWECLGLLLRYWGCPYGVGVAWACCSCSVGVGLAFD